MKLNRMHLGDILDYALRIYTKNFKKIMLVSLPNIIVAFTLAIVMIVVMSGLFSDTDWIMGTGDIEEEFGQAFLEAFSVIGAAALVVVGVLLLYFVYTITIKVMIDGCITKIALDAASDKPQVSIPEILRNIRSKFSKLVAGKVLSLLIMVAVYIGISFVFSIVFAVIMMLVALYASASVGSGIEGSVIGSVILAVLAIVLYIASMVLMMILFAHFYGKYSMAIPVVVMENKTGSESISRCTVLGKKRFWHISFTYTFAMALTNMIPTMFSYVFIFTMALDMQIFGFIGISVGQLLMAVMAPIITIAVTLMYMNMKIQKEGYDLELRVDKLLAGEVAIGESL